MYAIGMHASQVQEHRDKAKGRSRELSVRKRRIDTIYVCVGIAQRVGSDVDTITHSLTSNQEAVEQVARPTYFTSAAGLRGLNPCTTTISHNETIKPIESTGILWLNFIEPTLALVLDK